MSSRSPTAESSGVDFHCLLHVTEGRYDHMVDFETISCTSGSCVIIQPGQVNRFGSQRRWRGWMLVFRSELMQPESAATPIGELELSRQVDTLPTHVHTTGWDRRGHRGRMRAHGRRCGPGW